MDLFVVVVKRNCYRIFIFLRDTTAEAHFIGRTEPTVAIFLLPIRLLLNGEAGKWDGFQAGDRDLVSGHLAVPVGAFLDAVEGLFDLVEGVLFLREDGKCEIAVVGIAARIALVLAAAGCLAALRRVADCIAGHPGHGVDQGIPQVEQALVLLLDE